MNPIDVKCNALPGAIQHQCRDAAGKKTCGEDGIGATFRCTDCGQWLGACLRGTGKTCKECAGEK